MTDNNGRCCPICERGRLVSIEAGTWDCPRVRCNNQFFFESDGTLNVRDKPRTPLLARLWAALRAREQSA